MCKTVPDNELLEACQDAPVNSLLVFKPRGSKSRWHMVPVSEFVDGRNRSTCGKGVTKSVLSFEIVDSLEDFDFESRLGKKCTSCENRLPEKLGGEL